MSSMRNLDFFSRGSKEKKNLKCEIFMALAELLYCNFC